MQIIRISVYAKTVTLNRPYKLSGGRLIFDVLDSTFISMETACGLTGWAEACPWGHTYLPAHGPGIRAAAEILAPALLGQDPRKVDLINRVMDITLPGHLYAKAPLDIACWDLFGQSVGVPVVDLLGGRDPEPTPIASSIGTGTPDAMEAEIQEYRDRGYFVHSVKVGGADTALDIDRIRHLNAVQKPGEFIFYDVNRAWTPAEALTVMKRVGDLAVTFEQPCETLDQCAQVRALTTHPLSLDERLETETDMLRIIADGIGEIVNIKLNRVGGLTKARRIRDMALSAGFKFLIMDTGGTVVADTVVQHFAQSIPADRRLGTWLCQELLNEDSAPGRGSRNKDGCSIAPETPGIGVTPDRDFLGDPVAVYQI